ncbi:type I-F CRISPR-associated endoribonuclease Cas6/Csy4 [Marinobacter sp. M3C]|uniref:type I-F CRISPR-associated endoribonuclease Cas6/Csy4 n=1 Tax=Marinobacter sp. M3C TaxID=2917715 RepID=UPI00200D1B61|nr:type I-F CRISPR-associated endoribonuclease Cas6/Csy4 [Marinobacter sp. M3C]UQG58976.1 type I-F CRISPR-associated endoribonuclease Cas6/Csy4 [Marinobacter sp. M3C]
MQKYMDIDIRVVAGALVPVVASQVVKVVHHFMANSDTEIALALPLMKTGEYRQVGERIRLYAKDRPELDELADMLEGNSSVKDHIAVKRIKSCPENPECWVAYTRHRHPRKSDAKWRAEVSDKLTQMPVIYVRSIKQPDLRFGLGVVRFTSDHRSDSPGKLNGYGLSSRAAPYWLPEVS